MKVLTLTQPWATLVAIGAKTIETRSWPTKYRGPLAIHAAKHIPTEYRKLTGWTVEPFASVLEGVLWDKRDCTMNLFGQLTPGTQYKEYPDRLHLGCIIATCELVAVDELKYPHQYGWEIGRKGWLMTDQEKAFGDFTLGRFVWLLANVKPLLKPIPAKGSLGLWEFEVSNG
jgi:activating signal cointegrator 1